MTQKNEAYTENIFWPNTNHILKPVEQVAEYLNVHKNTIYRWIKSGQLECTRIGKSIHFTYAQIYNFLDKNRHQVKIY
ncbi:MAG: helix-turn-helix domain-containing protein [Calditrichaeota bacterium]|nr:helix-turn-helix domain-containing protein [Calditrichota bacterium]